MSYETVESGLAEQIKALRSFGSENVSLADWSILAHGHQQIAILEYQAFITDRDSYAPSTLFKWRIRVNLLVRYTEDKAGNNTLRDRRDEILIRILQNPKLPNPDTATALDSLPIEGGVADELIEIGGVSYLHEWIDVVIEEIVAA